MRTTSPVLFRVLPAESGGCFGQVFPVPCFVASPIHGFPLWVGQEGVGRLTPRSKRT